jgi:hypothetical protein
MKTYNSFKKYSRCSFRKCNKLLRIASEIWIIKGITFRCTQSIRYLSLFTQFISFVKSYNWFQKYSRCSFKNCNMLVRIASEFGIIKRKTFRCTQSIRYLSLFTQLINFFKTYNWFQKYSRRSFRKCNKL